MLSDHPVFPILLSIDLDASRTFYHDTLGLPILREDEGDWIVFGSGGGTQLAVTLSSIGTSDSQTQVAWRVPDIRTAIADLRARGVRIEEYSAPDPVTVDGVADMGRCGCLDRIRWRTHVTAPAPGARRHGRRHCGDAKRRKG